MPFSFSWETLSGRISSRQQLQFSVLFAANSISIFHNRVAVLDKVTDFLLFLGKLLIVGIVGMRAFIFRPTLSGETIGVSHLNPLTGFLSKQGFSLSSSSLGESKQWRTPLRLSTTTGCPYWSVDLYWLAIAAHNWKLSDGYFYNFFSLTFKKFVYKRMLLDIWTKSQWLYKQNNWVISNFFSHNGSDILL